MATKLLGSGKGVNFVVPKGNPQVAFMNARIVVYPRTKAVIPITVEPSAAGIRFSKHSKLGTLLASHPGL